MKTKDGGLDPRGVLGKKRKIRAYRWGVTGGVRQAMEGGRVKIKENRAESNTLLRDERVRSVQPARS